MPGLQTAVLSRLDTSTITPTSATYTGTIDTTWCIGSVPQGGYSLSIILNAVLAFMRTPELSSTNIRATPHLDPLLLSAMYVQAVTWTPFSVRIQVLKRGKSLSNLQAELWQDGVLRITTHVLMTNFAVQKEAADRTKEEGEGAEDDPMKNGYTITERSQWAPKYPLSMPEDCKKPRFFGNKAKSGKTFNFSEMLTLAIDPTPYEHTKSSNTLSSGAYYELTPTTPPSLNPEEVSTGRQSEGKNLIPFLADMFLSPPQMIPGKHKSHWYPTLHLTIEFKTKLPEKGVVERTGTYSTGRWMINGQHESNSELWSHPDDHELFGERERKPRILAIARQTALVLPMSVNENKTKAKAKL